MPKSAATERVTDSVSPVDHRPNIQFVEAIKYFTSVFSALTSQSNRGDLSVLRLHSFWATEAQGNRAISSANVNSRPKLSM
jgi:hypothetical protein